MPLGRMLRFRYRLRRRPLSQCLVGHASGCLRVFRSAQPDSLHRPEVQGAEGEVEDQLQNFSRVAFDADIPPIEDSSVCDVLTGKGCTNPPPGAVFYTISSITSVAGQRWWQLWWAYDARDNQQLWWHFDQRIQHAALSDLPNRFNAQARLRGCIRKLSPDFAPGSL